MKSAAIAGLVAAQLLAIAQPAAAADFAETRDMRTGAFAGLRLRVPLGADPERRRVQAGFTVAPTLHSTTMDGRSRTGFGGGIELGFAGGRPMALTLAGRPLDRLPFVPDRRGPDGRRANVSTLGWVAIGVGATVLVVGVAAVLVVNEIRENEYGP